MDSPIMILFLVRPLTDRQLNICIFAMPHFVSEANPVSYLKLSLKLCS